MAAAVDFGLLQAFSWIFPVLVVFAVTFSLLMMSGKLEKGMAAIISIAFALSILFVPSVIKVLRYAIPWLVLLFIFIFMVFAVFVFIAGDEVKEMITKGIQTGAYWWFVLLIVALIFVGAIAKVFLGANVAHPGDVEISETEVEYSQGQEAKYSLWDVLASPNILGLLFVLLVSVSAIVLLTASEKR